jgi:amino acid permease
MMAYILPGIFYYKLKEKHRWSLPKVGGVIMTLIGCIILPVCVTFIFLQDD